MTAKVITLERSQLYIENTMECNIFILATVLEGKPKINIKYS